MSAKRGLAKRPGFRTRIPVQALAAVPLAALIFAVDTFTHLASAVAVLYCVVILLAGAALHGRNLVLAAAACAALTVFSYLFVHGAAIGESSFLRCIISLSAIVVTTLLVLRNQASSEDLRYQAALLDLTHDAVFVRDGNDVIVYWNRGAEELYGWPAAEAIGADAHQLLRTRFPADLATIRAQVERDNRWEGELVHTTRDGVELITESRWARRGGDGAPAGTLETNTDITKRREADAALLQAQADLAHASRLTTLGQFTATIAHEVNQPLGAIATNGEAALRFLDRPEPDLAEVRGALGRIILGSKRASGVVARIRTQLKNSSPEKAPIDVADVIGEAVQLVQREMQSARIFLQLELEPGLPSVVGDRVQLQQVLINLLINGAHAMAEIDGPRRLIVRTTLTDDRQIRTEVRDFGVGIPEADLERLFDTFFTTKSDGMGLGLSICRTIIEAHGGRISAQTPEGPGALIAFTLPAAEAA